jgi:hypothetical protein
LHDRSKATPNVSFPPIADIKAARHLASMTLAFRGNLAAACLLVLTGNRPPEMHAGVAQHRTLGQSVACVSRTLNKVGKTHISAGTKSEAGVVRLLLWSGLNKKQKPDATVTLEGGPNFTAIGLDASTRRKADELWPLIRSSCGVTNLDS